MEYPDDLKYTATHEWIRLDGTRGRVGITAFAAGELSDIVFIDLPQIGKSANVGEEICVVESVKAASSIYAPVSGKVVDTNQALVKNPALLNQSCYQKGWLYELEWSGQPEEDKLLSNTEYEKRLEKVD